jgi:hypothetical protein
MLPHQQCSLGLYQATQRGVDEDNRSTAIQYRHGISQLIECLGQKATIAASIAVRHANLKLQNLASPTSVHYRS